MEEITKQELDRLEAEFEIETFTLSNVGDEELQNIVSFLTFMDNIIEEYVDDIIYYQYENGEVTVLVSPVDIDVIRDMLEEEQQQPQENLGDYEVLSQVIQEFHRGHEENGWTSRSVIALHNATRIPLDKITKILEENPFFIPNRNTWRYRLLDNE